MSGNGKLWAGIFPDVVEGGLHGVEAPADEGGDGASLDYETPRPSSAHLRTSNTNARPSTDPTLNNL
jgi:hypothetical protein